MVGEPPSDPGRSGHLFGQRDPAWFSFCSFRVPLGRAKSSSDSGRLPGASYPSHAASRQKKWNPALNHARLKALFVTGCAEPAAARNRFLSARMHTITKPFVLDELGELVRNIIEGASPGDSMPNPTTAALSRTTAWPPH